MSDKSGIVEFARALSNAKVELLSTGGTFKLLTESDLKVTEVSAHTGFPEMMDGRVKTLHPKIHGGLLGRRGTDDSVMAEHGIAPIDLLCVNLYPFENAVADENCTLGNAIENIDIGGPAMVRAGAKNWKDVAVVTSADQYPKVLAELTESGGTSRQSRFELATAAFNRIAQYAAAISNYLSSVSEACDDEQVPTRSAFAQQTNFNFHKVQDLRYGENPHQNAAFYRDASPAPGSLASYVQHQGKELSYNNLADSDSAWECVKQFTQAACVIVKHANPCGVAIGKSCLDAYTRAFKTDSVSAFGGIIAINQTLSKELARAIVDQQFVEVIIAPSVDSDALAVTASKANVRVITVAWNIGDNDGNSHDIKRLGSGLLVQDADSHHLDRNALKVVTDKSPDEQQIDDMLFAWKVAKFVKSNAIVYVRDGQTLGIGAGQMSRVDSARIGAWKAEEAKLSLKGAVMASDAFFPFRDGLDAAAERGVAAVIQPGGSMRDQEVIDAANEHGIAMAYTGIRHFRH